MANPQKENGFTPIANEILEQLVRVSLLGSEYQVLFFIIRKTYGYHKKRDTISLTQFESGTGLSRPTVVKTLKNLMTRNMVVKIYLPDQQIGYSFVKDHEKWVVNAHLLVKDKWVTSKGTLTETSKGTLTHKRKKDITKDNSNAVALRGITIMIEAFIKVNKACADFYGNTTQRKYTQKLIETYGEEKVMRVVSALPALNQKLYHKATTPKELWDKWAKIEAEAKGLKLKGSNYSVTKIH